ncbi:hypothetical protein [Clostridium botulinum]|uniref:Uncharacterized protein n=1 Tax=Clostridium botulinum (strain Langeland / NCTC 10281 / Type F) TaxID=441772 RepID=A7GB90_CLOBL|nr:hypothetical protein [Clostridium botulinum]ABS41525.1 conserved hypothetical protein [Clostridium botulinum F str. Langeland]ADF98511.1 conserved hypothetical protein [Clostridium botulinum F str. 230613]KKM40198.1 hypothetical protein VT72_18055 [Clostridium botulinum]MBY6793515.1 hypothetical protein [Clostridium botulinum]MBY6938919.1 hypothetical protein [Clostridium botulinum]
MCIVKCIFSFIFIIEKSSLLVILSDNINEELTYELIKNILENFSKVLTESSTREVITYDNF